MNRYFFILLACIALTLPLEFIFRARVYRRILLVIKAIWLPSSLYLAWDVLATHFGHWSFSPEHTSTVSLGGLPLEELAFFVVIPLCALLTYESVGHIGYKSKSTSLMSWLAFIVVFFTVGTVSEVYRLSTYPLDVPTRMFPYYTLATLIASVFFSAWVIKDSERRDFIRSKAYFLTIVICLFFMVFVNGYLTILDDPVVRYSANVGSRLFFDIPTEDFFYGTILISWVLIRWNTLTTKADGLSKVSP